MFFIMKIILSLIALGATGYFGWQTIQMWEPIWQNYSPNGSVTYKELFEFLKFGGMTIVSFLALMFFVNQKR